MKTLRFIVKVIAFAYVLSGLMLGLGILIQVSDPKPTFNWNVFEFTLYIFGFCFAIMTPIMMFLIFDKSILRRQAEHDKAMSEVFEQRRLWMKLNENLKQIILNLKEKQ